MTECCLPNFLGDWSSYFLYAAINECLSGTQSAPDECWLYLTIYITNISQCQLYQVLSWVLCLGFTCIPSKKKYSLILLLLCFLALSFIWLKTNKQKIAPRTFRLREWLHTFIRTNVDIEGLTLTSFYKGWNVSIHQEFLVPYVSLGIMKSCQELQKLSYYYSRHYRS